MKDKIKIDKKLLFKYRRNWDPNDPPKYVRSHKITGERTFRWDLNDILYDQEYYGDEFYEYAEIEWI